MPFNRFSIGRQLCLASLLVSTSCTFVVMEKPGASEMRQAEHYEEQGKYPLAIQQYEAALDQAWTSSQRAEILARLADYYSGGKGVPADLTKRAQLLQQASSLGYAPATHSLATAYRNGEGIAKNPSEAYYLYSTIADVIPKARLAMNTMHDTGEINPATAKVTRGYSPATLPEIEEMIRANDDAAMVTLAQFYRRGVYVDKDVAKAEEWYRKAIAQGNPSAAVELADMWMEEKTRKDPVNDALLLLKQGAEQGNATSMLRIGQLYESGKIGGRPQPDKAVIWYKQSAALGDVDALTSLAILTLNGAEGTSGSPEDAVRMFIKAAKRDSGTAYTELGKLAMHGSHGFIQNREKAIKFLRRGMQLGSTNAIVELGHAYRDGTGVPQNSATAIAYYQEAANRQTPSALVALGDLHRDGIGLPKDPKQAITYYVKAGELGVASAMRRVAWMSERGEGVARNPEQAFAWMQRAGEYGDIPAAYYLGLYHSTAYGTPRNDAEAVRWFIVAAQRGDARAMGELAYAFETGTGVTSDKDSANQWLQKAASAQPNRLVSQARSYISGKRVAQNTAKGRHLLQMADSTNVPGAREALAQLNRPAKIGKSSSKKSFATPEAAFAHYQSAATRGDTQAMIEVGKAYLSGKGTTVDMEQSFQWFQKAADKGSSQGMVMVAESYRLGRGITADNAQSFAWYEKAATAGSPEGEFQTGVAYARGTGVTADKAKAAHWLGLAATHGYPGASALLSTLSE